MVQKNLPWRGRYLGSREVRGEQRSCSNSNKSFSRSVSTSWSFTCSTSRHFNRLVSSRRLFNRSCSDSRCFSSSSTSGTRGYFSRFASNS